MSTYRRPDLPEQEFLDTAGQVIAFGSRWGGGDAGPPDGAYSVVTHSERFAPLHDVADALIAHLAANHDVELQDDLDVASDRLLPGLPAVRAVRVTPAGQDAAPLTFVFTVFPGVTVHAGLLHDFTFPNCGCDACDEDCESQAEDMENLVFAVVGGFYRETWRSGLTPQVGYSLENADGSPWMSGSSQAKDLPGDRVAAAKKRLKSLSDLWKSWPFSVTSH